MGCCRSWDQFWLLVWKNWLLQKRRIILTIVQIILPALFAFVLLIFRFRIKSEYISNSTIFTSFPVTGIDYSRLPSPGGMPWRLAYTPNTTLTAGIMNRAVKLMNVTTSPALAYDSEQSLVDALSTVSNVFGGIVFQWNDETSLPNNIVYKIRLRAEQYAASFGSSNSTAQTGWLTDFMYPTMPTVGPRQGNDTYGGTIPGYYYEGFLALQWGLDLSLIQEINGGFDMNNVETQLKRYPYPPYNDDKFIIILQLQLPFIILLSFIVIAPTICKDIVLEKEKKLKESMKLMGMRPFLHWCSWFFKFGIFMLISVLIMTIFFHIKTPQGAIINYSAPSVTFVFLLLYVLSLITFCFALSTFFSKASAGAAAGGIIYIASYVPYFFLSFRYDSLTLGSKIGASFDFNLAMAFGCVKISQYEGLGIGLQWSNLATPVSVDDSLTMLHIFIMLIVDIVLYLIITWYFDALLPGDFGTPQPFYFPFTRWYWCGSSSGELEACDDDFEALIPVDRKEYFEKPSASAKPGIKIRGLTKQFNKKVKPAVNNLTIDMYEGSITALLGHNGAGKTTTMFMLTGFLPPSHGTANINGLDIRKDMLRIRRNLGLCPQHDVLFDTMTVREHLTFFAKLKGCPSENVKTEVQEMIKVLHLEDKTDVQVNALSGGMKRKLCVGIALIAGSKFVILDEPTSGMDPEARRQTWDILQSQQNGRTMILSTHFMDEADLLGDRIAIMADGQIQCYGTPMFLKNKYGIGYHMAIVKRPNCNVDNLVRVVQLQVPEAQLESNVGAEVSFVLPREQSPKFEALFATLEKDQEALGIESFGASVTTMEEVFLRVGEAVDSTLESNLQNGHKTYVEENRKSSEGYSNGHYTSPSENGTKSKHGDKQPVFGVEFERTSGLSWYCLQFQAMFVKRVIHSMRNWIVGLVQFLVPVIFAIVACVIMVTLPGTPDLPPLYLNLSQFTKPVVPYDINKTSVGYEEITKLSNCYAQSISNSGSLVYLNNRTDYSTMDDFLVDVAKKGRDQYNRNYLIGATVEANPGSSPNATLIGWFNNAAYHTIAISLSYVTNSLMQCFGQTQYRIQTINHPLPWTLNAKVNQDISDAQQLGFIFSYCLAFGLAFLISTFVVFLIKERAVGAKHSQFISGVHAFNFWLSTFAWDFINYLLPAVLIIVVMECFQIAGYTDGNNAGFVFLDLLLYGWAIIPFMYVFSFLFQVASSGYVWATVLNIFTGTAAVLIVFILQIPSLGVVDVGNALEWIFYVIFPNFCFNIALQDLYANFQNSRICSLIDEKMNRTLFCKLISQYNQSNACCPENCGSFCVSSTSSYVSWESPGIGRSLFFMVIQGVVFFLIIVVIETDAFGRLSQFCTGRRNRVQCTRQNDELALGDVHGVSKDSDVLAERDRIINTPIGDLVKTDSVVMRELTKIFGDFVAVSQLSIGIPYGQCFGLLGVNGAGKTTSFKMLTGDIKATYGSAYVGGNSVSEDMRKVQQQVGYCPQFDAIIDQMTVRETLWMFACLRGIVKKDRRQVVDTLIDRLMLINHASKQVGNLSGGNKRKLSVAIALVGDSPIVFLDEPTTGMDPAARRLLWNTLTAVCYSGRTLILTSHSMEECEALCTRLAIMVNGVFQCLGSIQHLKAKFNEGYSLIIKVRGTDADDEDKVTQKINTVKQFVSDTFPGSTLKDYHEGLLNYQVDTPNLSWSRIFGTIEQAKNSLEIEDYSVSQTTLEQLFISFARKQREPQDTEVTCSKKCRQLFCCCCDC